jgi:hypothetical protein
LINRPGEYPVIIISNSRYNLDSKWISLNLTSASISKTCFMLKFPVILTFFAGFIHAFEADHLLAVSNIVSRRDNFISSVKDGIFWGIGHSSTIFLVGLIMIVFKAGIPKIYFHYFEALVGLMLIALAVYRLLEYSEVDRWVVGSKYPGSGRLSSKRTSPHLHGHKEHLHPYALAYGVGLVHGLAGSGALVLISMSEMKSPAQGLAFLVIFGLGCVAGMAVAAGLFSVPFSRKVVQAKILQQVLILVTASLCLIYGIKVFYENL